jgi:hypothetical protein
LYSFFWEKSPLHKGLPRGDFLGKKYKITPFNPLNLTRRGVLLLQIMTGMKSVFLVLIIVFCGAMSVWASRAPGLNSNLVEDSFNNNVAFPNVGVVEIAHPEVYTRVVAVSDVHGMDQTLTRLMYTTGMINEQGLWKAGKTLLIVDGDSIDKGPHSLEVLQFWINLTRSARASGGAIIHTLGNHEAEWLSNPMNGKAVEFRNEMQQLSVPWQQIWNPNYVTPPDVRATYLRSMPLAVRVGTWLFCHAGLYPRLDWSSFKAQAVRLLQSGAYGDDFITGENSILEAQDWWNDISVRQQVEQTLFASHMYGVVFGHQDRAFGASKAHVAAVDQMRMIKIDTGIKPDTGNPGELLIFTKPAQMNLLQPPDVAAMGVGGMIRPVISQ